MNNLKEVKHAIKLLICFSKGEESDEELKVY